MGQKLAQANYQQQTNRNYEAITNNNEWYKNKASGCWLGTLTTAIQPWRCVQLWVWRGWAARAWHNTEHGIAHYDRNGEESDCNICGTLAQWLYRQQQQLLCIWV